MTSLWASAPALPLHQAGPYVAGAYIVFVAVVLVYVAIMARRLTRNQRELAELRRELLTREPEASLESVDASAGDPEAESTAAPR